MSVLRFCLPSLLFISGCVLPGDFGDFKAVPIQQGGTDAQVNGGAGNGNANDDEDPPDGSAQKVDGGQTGGMDGGNSSTTGGSMDASMDAGPIIDMLCMMAGCDPAATCNSSSGKAICACPAGYLDFGVIDTDNPQPPGHVCFDFNECEDNTATCPSFSSCRNTAGAYACDCDTGYVKVGDQCLDGCTVLYTANKCSKTTATCSKPMGAAVCACKFGYKDISVKQDGSNCVVDDTCTGIVCDERALCELNGSGMPTCSCPDGYAGDGSSCDDINECSGSTFVCDANADCVNTEGGYACDCKDGFTGDGKTCVDVNECSDGTDTCSEDALCTNSPAGSYTCACKVGYDGNGQVCDDQDECALGRDDCSEYAVCTNSVGAWSCACKNGFTGNGVTCTDIDECATNNGGCGMGVPCSNSPGSFSCGCPQGESKVGSVCTNINECAVDLDNCSANATCTDDTVSGAPYYTCACFAGFLGDGVTCVDIDECGAPNNGGCGNFKTCSNSSTPGAAPTCTDINECLTNNGDCGSSTYNLCTNRDGAAPTCTDINECLTSNGGCGSATFYSCTNNSNGPPSCADINECLTNNGGCGNATFITCTNNAGAAATCSDINECLTNNGGCGNATFYVCTNNAGAAQSCADINECATNNGGCGSFRSCANNVGAAATCTDINECLTNNGGCGNSTFYSCANNNNAAPTCADINECATNNGGCGSFRSCTNNNGAAPTCTDINECLTNNGGCGSATFFSCTNNSNAAPTCADINECATNNGGCGSFRSCTNNNGAAPTCTDINECLTNNGGCGSATFFTCVNNSNAAPTCADINECAINNGGCGSSTFFSCTNNSGALPTCADINECATNNGGCGNVTFFSCTNNNGAAPTCADRNECATNNGGCGSATAFTCTNNVGAAATCTDINECSANTDGCDNNPDACVNSSGSFSCVCPAGVGYTGNGVGASGCLRDECTLNTDDCDDIGVCTNTQEAWSCSCGPGYTGTGTGATGCCTPDGVKTDVGFPNDGIDNDCNGFKDKAIIAFGLSFPEVGGASSGADVSIAVAPSNVTSTSRQLQFRKYKRLSGPGTTTFSDCAGNPCSPFTAAESASSANNGAWSIEVRWRYVVAAGSFFSESDRFDTYVHSSMHGAPKCPALGVTDADLFLAADTDLRATLVGKTSTGYQMVDPGNFAVGTDTFVTSPFITVGYKPVTGGYFDIKRIGISLSPPTATTVPTYSADMLSLRRRFVISGNGRYLLIRRVYASSRSGRCEAAQFEIASSDRLYAMSGGPRGKQKFITAHCDAVVLNRAGAGVCLDVNAGVITQTFGQSPALRTNAPGSLFASTLGYGDSNKFMWRQLLDEKDYNRLFPAPVAPTHTIFRNFSAKCDTAGCNSSPDDGFEIYLPDRSAIR